jgi:hypothetical protein
MKRRMLNLCISYCVVVELLKYASSLQTTCYCSSKPSNHNRIIYLASLDLFWTIACQIRYRWLVLDHFMHKTECEHVFGDISGVEAIERFPEVTLLCSLTSLHVI